MTFLPLATWAAEEEGPGGPLDVAVVVIAAVWTVEA